MIRLALLVVTICLAAWSATAQDYPALHNVVGVAGDDVLNIRSAPSASATIVGSLGPYRTGVEVISSDPSGRWGLVNTGETSGWTSLRYLSRERQGEWMRLDQTVSCSGTEPFWSLSLNHSPNLSAPDGDSTSYFLMAINQVVNRSDKAGFYAVSKMGADYPVVDPSSISGFLSAQSCNDGMSDREYGIAVDLMVQKKNLGLTVLTGCCSLQP